MTTEIYKVFLIRPRTKTQITIYLSDNIEDIHRVDPPKYEEVKYTRIPYQPFGYHVFLATS